MKTYRLMFLVLLSLFFINSNGQSNYSKLPVGKKLVLQLASNYGNNLEGIWDISGSTKVAPGSVLQLSKYNNDGDKKFILYNTDKTGYYKISPGNSTYTRLGWENVNSYGENKIVIRYRYKTETQMFLFKHLGEGKYKIYSTRGKVLAYKNNRVQFIFDDNSENSKWYLIDGSNFQALSPISTHSLTSGADGLNYNSKEMSVYKLQTGEEFVYGKVGLFDNGDTKYTLAIVRKPNRTKKIYRRGYDPYTSRPIMSGRPMRVNNSPKEYDKFDYWLVFNGKKMGPYDKIFDIDADDPDIDDWVSEDGKKLSFCAIKGQHYYANLGGRQTVYYWSLVQKPQCDKKSGKYTYAMEWSTNNWRLYDNGSIRHSNWKNFHSMRFSDDGSNVIYVGAPDKRNQAYVYLNHKKVAGPYSLVGQVNSVGFIPGTNKAYYKGAVMGSKNNRATYNYGTIVVGDRKFDIPDNHGVGNFQINGDIICFTVTNYDKKAFYGSEIEVWEYNHKTDVLKKHGKYGSYVNFKIIGNKFYYSTFDVKGNNLLVKQGGEVVEKVTPKNHYVNQVAPNGEIISWYKTKSDYESPYYLLKNGKPYSPFNIRKKYVDKVSFNPLNSKPQIILKLDQPVGSEKRKIMYGNNSFNLNGYFTKFYFPEKSENVFGIRRIKKTRDDYRWQLYKNNNATNSKEWTGISPITYSPDGKRYAALVTDDMKRRGGGRYYTTENGNLDALYKLFMDGKVVEGKFGLPVWSKKSNKFKVLKKVNGEIKLVEM